MKERWKAVVGFEGLYEVSDQGRVRSLSRPRTPGKVLAQAICTNRYPQVALSKEGVRTMRTVHSIVCEAFHGPRPGDGYWVAHDNGINQDCRAGNLAWKTVAANMADKRRHGTQPVGERCWASKLTDDVVLHVRRRYDEGCTKAAIAREVNCAQATVRRILDGTSWSHLQ